MRPAPLLRAVYSDRLPDVPAPSDFSIPYTDLELTTPDNVKIKTFLLLQRPVLNMNETPVEWDGASDEEVRPRVPSTVSMEAHGMFSSRQRDRQCSCSMAMAEITATASHWARSFSARCGAMFSCYLIAGMSFLRYSPQSQPPLTRYFYPVATATLRALLLRRVRAYNSRASYVNDNGGVGLQTDAQTVLDYVHAHPLLAKTQIVRPPLSLF